MPLSAAAYKNLHHLRDLSTTLIEHLHDVPQLTQLKLCTLKSYVNLKEIAETLPHLRSLKGLPFKSACDHRYYWPLRQCSELQELVTLPGCAALSPSYHVAQLKWTLCVQDGWLPAHVSSQRQLLLAAVLCSICSMICIMHSVRASKVCYKFSPCSVSTYSGVVCHWLEQHA